MEGIRVIRWELTPACGRKCVYCQLAGSINAPNRVPGNWIAIARQLAKSNAGTVVLTGGEPTFHDDLDGIVRLLSEAGKTTVIQTNGDSPIPPHILEKTSCISLSLDSPYEPVNDRTRGIGSFKACGSLIEEIVKGEARPVLVISTVLTAYNAPGIRKLVSYCNDHRVDSIHISRVQSVGRAKNRWSEIIPDHDTLLRTVIEVQAEADRLNYPVKWSFLPNLVRARLAAEEGLKLTLEDQRSLVGRGEFYVTPDGSVYPDFFLSMPDHGDEWCGGNLQDNGLELILESPAFERFRAGYLAPAFPQTCSVCKFFRTLCEPSPVQKLLPNNHQSLCAEETAI